MRAGDVVVGVVGVVGAVGVGAVGAVVGGAVVVGGSSGIRTSKRSMLISVVRKTCASARCWCCRQR